MDREVRDRIYEETKDMTWEGRRQWSEEWIRSDPSLARLWDRMSKSRVIQPRGNSR